MYVLFVIILIKVTVSVTEEIDYKRYDARKLEKFYNSIVGSKSFSVDSNIDINEKPKHPSLFDKNLKPYKASYEIIPRVQNYYYKHRKSEELKEQESSTSRIDLNKYHTHEEINAYLNELVHTYPDIASVEYIGNSYEGRKMNLLKISTGHGNGNKPAIFVDGGIHGREWLSIAETLCLISFLIEDPNNRYLIENVDWYILPIVNPDGYNYTHAGNRMWRKTRSKGIKCTGADANRNFDFHWMESGADAEECSEIYAGKHPFSEIESANLANSVLKYKNQIKLYLTFHSCGKFIIFPWSYAIKYPDNYDEMLTLAKKASVAIANVNGTRYSFGNSADLLHPTAGSSDDWAKGVAGVPLAYTIELPCGERSFIFPENQIQGVCKETFEGIKVFHKHLEDNYS